MKSIRRKNIHRRQRRLDYGKELTRLILYIKSPTVQILYQDPDFYRSGDVYGWGKFAWPDPVSGKRVHSYAFADFGSSEVVWLAGVHNSFPCEARGTASSTMQWLPVLYRWAKQYPWPSIPIDQANTRRRHSSRILQSVLEKERLYILKS